MEVYMENIVYFLGAGFSAPLGLPVMNNFWSKAKDLYVEKNTEFKYFKEIFELRDQLSIIKNFINIDLYNMEDILSLLEMKSLLTVDNKEAKHYLKLYKKFIKDVIEYYTPYIKTTLSDKNDISNWYSNLGNNSIHSRYLYFLSNLLNILIFKEVKKMDDTNIKLYFYNSKFINSNFHYSIITLNFDLVIEKFVKLLDVHKGSNLKNKIEIVHLHGDIANYQSIIPPTWNKSSINNVIDNWALARNIIKNANYIRIIGYSLPINDNYIRFLFSLSLEENFNLKGIDIITLDSDDTTYSRYKNIFNPFPNYRYCSKSIENYFNKLFSDMYSYTAICNKYETCDIKLKFDGNVFEKLHNEFMNENIIRS